MAFVYIVRCADDTLYVGHTDDLVAREQLHNRGQGAKYTAARTPIRIVYAEEHTSIKSALAREHQLKRWSAKKKEALIGADRVALRSLALKPTTSNGTFTWRDLLERGSPSMETHPPPPPNRNRD